MSLDCLKSVNWVDIIVLLIFLRAVISGSIAGFLREFVSGILLVITFYLTLFYLSFLSGSIQKYFKTAFSISDFIAFIGIFLVVNFAAKFFLMFFKFGVGPQEHSVISRLMGAVVGLVKAWIQSGVLIIILILTPISGIYESVNLSVFSSKILKSNLKVYSTIICKALEITKTDKKIDSAEVFEKLNKQKDFSIKILNFDLNERRAVKEAEGYQ